MHSPVFLFGLPTQEYGIHVWLWWLYKLNMYCIHINADVLKSLFLINYFCNFKNYLSAEWYMCFFYSTAFQNASCLFSSEAKSIYFFKLACLRVGTINPYLGIQGNALIFWDSNNNGYCKSTSDSNDRGFLCILLLLWHRNISVLNLFLWFYDQTQHSENSKCFSC